MAQQIYLSEVGGSGKSAIFKYYAEINKGKPGSPIVLEISPEEYAYEFISETLRSELQGSWAKRSAYAVSWKFALVVLSLNALHAQHTGRRTTSSKQVEKYLTDNGYLQNISTLSLLVRYLKRLEEVKIGCVSARFKTHELQQLYKLEDINNLFPAIKEMCNRNGLTILVDELDRGWDGSDDAKNFVSGLFQAATQLNNISKNFRVLISLRKELYDNIPELYDDVQKIRDVVQYIQWDEKSLKEMISRRIHKAMKLYFTESPEDTWRRVFVETLQYRNSSSFNYLVDRTLFRPRELIQFCTDCLSELGAGSGPIDYEVISRAEGKYSRDRIQDIANEYKFQYPGILGVFETFRGMPYTLSRLELENHCLEIIYGDRPCQAAGTWLEDFDSGRLIRALWEVGFLKALAVGGQKSIARSGSRYLGPYQVSTLNVDAIANFQVHPMFRDYLGLKEKK